MKVKKRVGKLAVWMAEKRAVETETMVVQMVGEMVEMMVEMMVGERAVWMDAMKVA